MVVIPRNGLQEELKRKDCRIKGLQFKLENGLQKEFKKDYRETNSLGLFVTEKQSSKTIFLVRPTIIVRQRSIHWYLITRWIFLMLLMILIFLLPLERKNVCVSHSIQFKFCIRSLFFTCILVIFLIYAYWMYILMSIICRERSKVKNYNDGIFPFIYVCIYIYTYI